MPKTPQGEKMRAANTRAWKIARKQRQSLKVPPGDRDAELTAIEQHIATKGVTIAPGSTPAASSEPYVIPQPLPGWRS